MNFSLRQLEYAVAVAEHLNFTEAAAACHVSQPSLSAQIQQLESALGGALFERTARRVVITEFGQRVVDRARRVLEEARDLADLARAEGTPLCGELRLGMIPTVAPYVLPALLSGVRARYPRCRLRCVEGRTQRLVEALKANELDVLLLALEADLGGLETLALWRDPFLVALPPGHLLAERQTLRLEDLPLSELLLLEEGHCLADQVRTLCGPLARGASMDVRATSLPTLEQLVRLGEGLTLLPAIAVRSAQAGRDLELRPLEPTAYRTIGLAWRPQSPRSPEFALFGDLVEEVAGGD